MKEKKEELPLQRTTIARLYADAQTLGGQHLTVAGWVRSLRDMKTFGFITLNDGSCFNPLQVVMEMCIRDRSTPTPGPIWRR